VLVNVGFAPKSGHSSVQGDVRKLPGHISGGTQTNLLLNQLFRGGS